MMKHHYKFIHPINSEPLKGNSEDMTKLNYVIIWFSNPHNINIDNVLFYSLKNAVQQW